METPPNYLDRTVLIHGRFRTEKWNYSNHIVPPVTTSVSFRLESADRGAEAFRRFANPDLDRHEVEPIYVYDRLDDPSQGMLEEALAFAEKGETAVSFETGMAAMSAAIGVHVRTGDHVLLHRTVYGCTYSLVRNWLSRFGVEHTLVDMKDLDAVREAIRPETKVIQFESPTNPTLEIIDIPAVVALVREVNAVRPPERHIATIVDNTFATPFCQRPIALGVDMVVHSLTKNLSGFGTDMGGAIICRRNIEPDVLLFRKDFGGSLSPKAAWHIATYGVSTLALRMERQQRSACEVADFLLHHPLVARVNYPGLCDFPQYDLAVRQMRDIDGQFAPGSMVYFEVVGEGLEAKERAIRVINHIAERSLCVTLAVSLGQIRTLVEAPYAMTHSVIPEEDQQLGGISPAGIRLSLGIEDVRDIIRDLGEALDRAG